MGNQPGELRFTPELYLMFGISPIYNGISEGETLHVLPQSKAPPRFANDVKRNKSGNWFYLFGYFDTKQARAPFLYATFTSMEEAMAALTTLEMLRS